MILVDTDILIDGLNDIEEAKTFLREHREEIRLSPFTVFELLEGVRNKNELRLMKSKISYEILPMDQGIIESATEILESHFLRDGTGMVDALLAATAIRQGIALYSRNKKHYKGIQGLRLVIPY